MAADKPPEVPSRRRLPLKKDEPLRFTDSDDDLSARALFEMYSSKLPLVVVVSQGVDGEIEIDNFSSGQVMMIHSYINQERVVARDSHGRTISIPTNYPLKFRLVKSSKKVGEPESLKEILEGSTLPLQVQFAESAETTFRIGADQERVKGLSNLALTVVYDETFMVANCINTRTLEKEPVLLPVYLKDITLSLVTGLEGKTEKDWKTYLEILGDELKAVKLGSDMGNKDIALFSEEPMDIDSIYAYIEIPNPNATDDSDDDNVYTVVGELDEDKPPLPKRQPKVEKSTSRGKKEKGKPKPDLSLSADTDPPHGYVNDIPRSKVQPFSFLKKVMDKKDSSAAKVISECDVKDLTIDGLTKKLKELKLDKYVKPFREQQIDGSIAVEMNEDLLKSEFKFNAIEAIKLMKYVRTGHIPK